MKKNINVIKNLSSPQHEANSKPEGIDEPYFIKPHENQIGLGTKEFYNLLLKNITDGIAVFQDGALIYATPGFKILLGHNDLSGFQKLTDFYPYIHPDDLDRLIAEIENSIKNKVDFQKYAFRFKRNTGEYCWIENSVKREYNDAGENHRIFVTGRDITDRKESEQQIIDLKEKLELALSEAKMGIWEWYVETNIVNWYGSHATLFGISDKDFGGTIEDVQKIVHPDDRNRGMEAFEKTITHGTEFINTYRVIWPDKSIHWLFSNGNLIYNPQGKPWKIIGITQDISSEKLLKDQMINQNRELAELNSTKDKLFSIISHDLVNPLNSLLGFAQIMDISYNNSGADIESYIKMILRSANAMADMLKTLSQWSRSQRGKINIHPTIIIPSIITDAAFNLALVSAQAKQINLVNNIPPDVVAYADEEMINTIVRNLISNAVKFSHPRGTVAVDYYIKNNAFVFKIIDDGLGIASSRLKDLFKISASESTPGTAGEKGTGLGLLICKEFAALNYGEIWVESTLGKGSVFYLSIPAEPKSDHEI